MVAMGIGRFLYTPLLPLMLAEYALRPDQAGLLASFNYIGYLIGAFSAGPLCHRFREYPVLAAGLLLSCATSAATGLYTPFLPLAVARLVAGIASALAFVAVSGLVLRIIARDNRENLAGLYYGGVGGGIVLTGLVSPPVARAVGAAATWEIFAAVSLLLSGMSLLLLFRHHEPQSEARQGKGAALPRQGAFLRLVASYGCEGFGYIITGTFMVAAAQATVGAAGAQFAWIVAGCAALPSAFLWSSAARRWSRPALLVAAYLLQAIGIVLPAVFSGALALVAGAVLFGATFMGIVTLALSEGASYEPAARARIVGFMTGVYGIGQIVGPALAGHFAARTGSYRIGLVMACVAVLLAGVILIPDVRRKSRD